MSKADPKLTELKFEATKHSGMVSALLLMPADPEWVLVLGHGAGAGMRHPFMENLALRLAGRRIATFRYQFSYMERKERRPDPKPVLLSTVRSAVVRASEAAKGLPLLAGGKSMGGRMTSMAASEGPLPNVRGIVFFGFPLHPPGRPAIERGDHLFDVGVPMLFLQGTRDKLADLKLLKPICEKLGQRATLHVIDGADHSFHMLKSSGRTDDQALDELAQTTAGWGSKLD